MTVSSAQFQMNAPGAPGAGGIHGSAPERTAAARASARRIARALLAVALAWAGAGIDAATAQVPRFDGVGDLPGGAVSSAVLDISADGSIAVGESESADGIEAFSWTLGGGLTGLGFLSLTDPYSTATGISADGSVIAGSSKDGSGVVRAYRHSSGTMTALAGQSCSDCDPVTRGQAISADGLVVVGASAGRSGSTAPLRLDPVRWPGGGTGLSNLGNLPGGDEVGEAFGVSSNGSVIAGNHMSSDGKDAFYWTGSGLNALPTITGGSIIAANAFAVSDDGSTIVGYTNKTTVVLPGGTEVATDLQAVRWTGAGYSTLEQLGDFPGAQSTDSRALATSADGSIVVGRAQDANLVDRAFIWDAVGGMRDLKTELTEVYGLDLTGWILSEATAISDVVAGDFYLAGSGINPQGDPEGWVAYLSIPACSNGIDDDGDGPIDHPADPGCTDPADWSELDDCADGLDNDGDGDVDFGADADCRSASDATELPDCSDGYDNDADGDVDHPADAGCASPASQREDPACSNGDDDDLDGKTDYPADPECLAASDASEVPDCSDGLDNDGDGWTDHPADPECDDAADLSEAGECADGIDNDGDGRIDYPSQYPGCIDADDPIEAPQCSDGVDNDLDGQIDHPADLDCAGPDTASESQVAIAPGDLVAVDRTSRALFRVDTGDGSQTLISQAAFMQAPQGVAHRGFELVVADPAGLIAVAPTGEQRLASEPLLANESLQVLIDENGDAFVLEATGISKVAWSSAGLGTRSTFMAMPTPEPIPVIGLWHGDTLAREASGDFLVTGLSLWGDGVFRVDALTQAATILLLGFDDVMWLDLALEQDGTILAVGFKYDQATGVYRVDPVSGVATALNNTYGWQRPTAVAIDALGEIYVADAGLCVDGSCSGGEIVHVDPSTGAVTPVSSGGLIGGEMDLMFVPEPGAPVQIVCGLVALTTLASRRHRRPRGPGA